MPAPSCPSTIGRSSGNRPTPSTTCRSLWQTPVAAVRTSTSRPHGLSTSTGFDGQRLVHLAKDGGLDLHRFLPDLCQSAAALCLLPLIAPRWRVYRLDQYRSAERCGFALGGGIAVERRALARLAAQRADQRLHAFGRHLLAVHRAGGAGDALVHQGAAEIVGACREAGGGAALAHLDPGGLDVADDRVQHQARDRMHQHRLAVGRAAPCPALEVDRRLHRHEGQRHEFGEAAGARLQCADAQQMPRPVLVAVDMTVHDRDRAAQPDAMRRLHDLEPLPGLDLVGADHGADLVVEDLGRGAGQGAEPGLLQLAQKVRDRAAEGLGALPDLERREGVDMNAGHRLLDGAADREIGRARCIPGGCRPAGRLRWRRAPRPPRPAAGSREGRGRRAGRANSR